MKLFCCAIISLMFSLTGCMPFSLSGPQKQHVVIVMKDGVKVEVTLIDADENDLIGVAPDSVHANAIVRFQLPKSSIATIRNDEGVDMTKLYLAPPESSPKRTYPRLDLLPLSVIAFAITWDYFERADKAVEYDKHVMFRDQVVCSIAFAAGVTNLIISLQPAAIDSLK